MSFERLSYNTFHFDNCSDRVENKLKHARASIVHIYILVWLQLIARHVNEPGQHILIFNAYDNSYGIPYPPTDFNLTIQLIISG